MKKLLLCLLFLLVFTAVSELSAEPPIEVIYWKSSDVQMPTSDEIDSIRDVMIAVQSFFASEMERHGFGEKTFDFKDIKVVEGQKKRSEYTSHWTIANESALIERGLDNQIYVVFFGGSGHIGGNSGISQQLCANIPEQLIYCNNLVVIPTGSPHIILPLAAHEIGHAFSLDHAPNRLISNKVDIMYFPLAVVPGVKMDLKDFVLNQRDATFLNDGGRLSVQEVSQDLAQEIDADANAVPDLVAYYPFDRNSEDASGNGNHGEIIGRANYVDGKFGEAIVLNNGVYVEMDASDSLHRDLFRAEPFTLSVWVYPRIETGYGHVWRSLPRESGHNTLFIIEDAGIISLRGRIDDAFYTVCETDPGLFEANAWIHVAVTNDGDKFRIYANGEVVAESNFQETDGGSTTYLIGSQYTGGENFVGLIDDYAVFSKALKKNEINSIMEMGVERFLQTKQSAATVSLSPVSVESPNIGQHLELSLKITNGENVAGYQATVQFDDTALRYVRSRNSDYLPDGAFFVTPILEGNLLKLNAVSLEGESSGDGILATVTFEIIRVKTSSLTLSGVLLSNSIGETFTTQLENAEITEPPKLTGDVNGDGTVNIVDLVMVASNLGQTGPNPADVNGDGVVNIADLVLVAGALGTRAAAPSLHLQALETVTATEVRQWLSTAQRLNLTDMTSQRGIRFLQQLLVALTPKETALLPNYPNPFNPETWIPYHLAERADVTLRIYTVEGALVRTLPLGHQAAGKYQPRDRAAYWDGRNDLGERVASGIYLYQLTTPSFQQTRRLVIVK